MAILKDFIDQVSFEEVWPLMGGGSEELKEYEESVRNILEELKKATPKENTEQMVIRFVVAEDPMMDYYFYDSEEEAEEAAKDADETYLQVYGFRPGDEEGYAIGVKSPETLVGLDVDEETAANYSPAEIVANCLADMTYCTSATDNVWSPKMDTYAGGMYASQLCMSEDIQGVDLDALRESLGVIPKPEEDYKTKYGFLF